MIKAHVSFLLVGAALMAWGGTSITSRLGLIGWQRLDVAVFALGVIALAQTPYFTLAARIRRIEAAATPAPTLQSPAS